MEKYQLPHTGRMITVAPSVPGAVPEHPDSAEYQVTTNHHQNGNFWLGERLPTEAVLQQGPGVLAAQRAVRISKVYVEQAGMPIEDTPL